MSSGKQTLTARVRAAAQELMVFTTEQIEAALMVQTYRAADKVRRTISELKKRGEAVTLAPGVFKYVPQKAPGHAEKATRIFRAMHIKGKFCGKDIALLTDAETSYVRAVIRRLVDDGDLESLGQAMNGNGRKETFYRVRHRDNFYMKHVYEGKKATK